MVESHAGHWHHVAARMVADMKDVRVVCCSLSSHECVLLLNTSESESDMSGVSRACSRWWAARERVVACRPRAGCWRPKMPSGAGQRAAQSPAILWPSRETAATSPCACLLPPRSPMTACMLLVCPFFEACAINRRCLLPLVSTKRHDGMEACVYQAAIMRADITACLP